MKIIGLTGGIATGKSTVAEMMANMGAEVIDADELSRQVVAPGSATLQRLAKLFGDKILLADGSLDRQAVRSVVFADRGKLKDLESILHPAIKKASLDSMEEFRKRGVKIAVYMAPLLIEAEAADRVDEVWVVTVRPDIQIARLMERDKCTVDEARSIIGSQMPLEEKASYGVVLIDNSDSVEYTRKQVVNAWKLRGLGWKVSEK